uniref:Interleukin 17C n=1 Tax=Zosterops lateralis melanops TaxID=1220523 RepID=A0A8D2Q2T3_ZOSLA
HYPVPVPWLSLTLCYTCPFDCHWPCAVLPPPALSLLPSDAAWEKRAGGTREVWPCPRSIDEDENRYPRKLAFAECLCSGCVDVKTGRETTSLNSVTIHQTMLVLRRKPCPRPAGPGLVALEVDYIRVPVGCTCVLPRTVS